MKLIFDWCSMAFMCLFSEVFMLKRDMLRYMKLNDMFMIAEL